MDSESELIIDIITFIKLTDEYITIEQEEYEKIELKSGIPVGIYNRQFFDNKSGKLYDQKVIENPLNIQHIYYEYNELINIVDELYSRFKIKTFKGDVILLIKKNFYSHYNLDLSINVKSFFVKSYNYNQDCNHDIKKDKYNNINIDYIMINSKKQYSSTEFITITNVSGKTYSFDQCVKIFMHIVNTYSDYTYLLLNNKADIFINELIQLEENNNLQNNSQSNSQNNLQNIIIDRDHLEMYEGWLLPK
jgi:hypothetical protein